VTKAEERPRQQNIERLSARRFGSINGSRDLLIRGGAINGKLDIAGMRRLFQGFGSIQPSTS
jgi:hypothetical protein